MGKLVFVMGGGKFGTDALRYLRASGAKVLVIDVDPDCLASREVDFLVNDLGVLGSLKDGEAAFFVGDAVDVLGRVLETGGPDLVVTAIQGNAVAKLVQGWLGKRGFRFEVYSEGVVGVLENIPKSLVLFVDQDSAVIVVSYMPSNLRCRDNCLPPKGVCASTGRPKLGSMKRLLDFSVYDIIDQSMVLVSKQLTGGLGAIDGKELQCFLEQLENVDKPYTLAVGTACECHGIINLAKIKK